MRRFHVLLAAVLLLASPVNTPAYDYPVANPYIATIAGTPTAYKADLKLAIPEEHKELRIARGATFPPSSGSRTG